jgi:C4-dicarboxylate-specific signal transduction histidine kinase
METSQAAEIWALDPAQGRPRLSSGTSGLRHRGLPQRSGLRRQHDGASDAGRMATLEEMNASIAHELNQPLAAIAVNAETSLRWLTRANPDPRKAIAAIQRIIGDVERASGMIQRIRALATNGKRQVSKLDINDVVDEVVTLVKRESCSERVSLRVRRAARLPAVQGDFIQLQQVVMNLVVNGIQAMAPLADRAGELVIRTRHDADTVSVLVRDSGVGTDLHDFDQLFRAFYSTKANGMGMGLAISRAIIEAHHGRIWATRNSGPGMTFQFSVPIYRPGATTAP